MDFSVYFTLTHSIDRAGSKIESAGEFYSLWIFLKGNFTTISSGSFEYDVWNYIKKNILLESYPRFQHPEFSNM